MRDVMRCRVTHDAPNANALRISGGHVKKLLGGILSLFVALMSQPAYCGDTSGTVMDILILSDIPDRLFVKVTGSNSHPLACSTQNNRYVVDTSTNTGKQIYAALLAARHASAVIT